MVLATAFSISVLESVPWYMQERLTAERAKKEAAAKEAAAARGITEPKGKPEEKDRRAQNGEAGRDGRDRGRDGRNVGDRDRAEQDYRDRDRDRMPARSERSACALCHLMGVYPHSMLRLYPPL